MVCFAETEKSILKFIWKLKTPNNQNHPGKERTRLEVSHFISKLTTKLQSSNTVLLTYRQTYQQNSREPRNKPLNVVKRCSTTVPRHAGGKGGPGWGLSSCEKFNFKWLKNDLNIQPETKIPKRKQGKILMTDLALTSWM